MKMTSAWRDYLLCQLTANGQKLSTFGTLPAELLEPIIENVGPILGGTYPRLGACMIYDASFISVPFTASELLPVYRTGRAVSSIFFHAPDCQV